MATTQELPDGIYFGENLTVMILIEDNDGIRLFFSYVIHWSVTHAISCIHSSYCEFWSGIVRV